MNIRSSWKRTIPLIGRVCGVTYTMRINNLDPALLDQCFAQTRERHDAGEKPFLPEGTALSPAAKTVIIGKLNELLERGAIKDVAIITPINIGRDVRVEITLDHTRLTAYSRSVMSCQISWVLRDLATALAAAER